VHRRAAERRAAQRLHVTSAGARSMRYYTFAMTAVAVAVATARLAIGADEPPGQVTAGAAARAVAVGLVADWNSHDMKSFAELFAEDADFVNVIGLWWRGRPEIQKEHETLHATRMRNSNLIAAEIAVRLLRPDVAVIHVRWQLTGDTGIDGVRLPPRQGVLSFVTVRTGSKWLIASAQNTDVVPLPNVPPPR
jgi:uncharacterized protein (TIGR02246 family)